MDKLISLISKHPVRRKYGLMIADIIFILIAIKIFINYTNIIQAINETRIQAHQKDMQVEYTKNFQIPYEKSEHANLLLKHENNILAKGEFIIKFEQAKPQSLSGNSTDAMNGSKDNSGIISTMNPQQSRQQFFKEKLLQ